MSSGIDLTYLKTVKHVAVFGASGSIGSAFVQFFLNSTDLQVLYAFSRSKTDFRDSRVRYGTIDYSDESSIEVAKSSIQDTIVFDLIIIATGALHIDAMMPEKALSHYNSEKAQLFYQINTIGPSLIMKHFWPLLNKKMPSVMAAMCARIGSIEDNRLGGWYSYRAAKAALAMMVKSISIEVKRRNSNAICVTLHPGTVDSQLSAPFHKHIDPAKIMSPADSVAQLVSTISTLTIDDSGFQYAYDGSRIPF